MPMIRALEFCARHGRLVLVLGLVAGVALPDLARALRPWLPQMVAGLLFLSAFRIGWEEVLGQFKALWRVMGEVLALQLLMPLAAFALFSVLGVVATVPALAVLLMLAAPSVTGAPNFTILAGRDPAPAMQVLILGTALFPLTVLPLLWLYSDLMPGAGNVMAAAGRLIAVILVAVVAGFVARKTLLAQPSDAQTKALDGLGVVALAVIVVGLMTGLGAFDTGRSGPVDALAGGGVRGKFRPADPDISVAEARASCGGAFDHRGQSQCGAISCGAARGDHRSALALYRLLSAAHVSHATFVVAVAWAGVNAPDRGEPAPFL